MGLITSKMKCINNRQKFKRPKILYKQASCDESCNTVSEMTYIPDEIMTLILIYLPTVYILTKANLVCHKWHILINSLSFWLMKLRIDGINICHSNIKKIIAANTDDKLKIKVIKWLQFLCLSHCSEVVKLIDSPRIMFEEMIEGILSHGILKEENEEGVEFYNECLNVFPYKDILNKEYSSFRKGGHISKFVLPMNKRTIDLSKLFFPLDLFDFLNPAIYILIWVEEGGAKWWYKTEEPIEEYPKNLKYINFGECEYLGAFPWRRRGRHSSYSVSGIIILYL